MPIGVNKNVSVGVPNTQGAGKVKSFNDGYLPYFEEANFLITGISKDSAGNPLGSCIVKLFNTATDVLAQQTTSDLAGNYSFIVDKTQSWYVVAYRVGAPDVSGTTVNTLKGAQGSGVATALAFYAYSTNFSSLATCTNTLTGVPVNTTLVLSTSAADDSPSFPNGSIVSSPVITWTKRVQSKAATSGNTEIWTALFAAGGTITTTYTGATADGGISTVLYAVINTESTLAGAFNSATGQNNESVAVTTTRANSILFCVSSDWAAIDGTSRAYRDSAIEVLYYTAAGKTTGFHYYKITTAIASYTEGLTAPTTTAAAGTSVLEIRGQ